MARRKNIEARMRGYQEEYKILTARLAEIGFIWPGSIQRRMMTCGKPNCACQTDPEARHGPYPYWTSKEAQKTISKLLSPEEADLFEEWIENRRQLDEIVRKMKKLSKKAAKTELKLRARRRRTDERER